MALLAYNWPLSGAAARGVDIAAYGAGVVVPDWSSPVLWPYASGHFTAGIVLASGTPGLSSIVADAASGVWAVSYVGTLYHQPATGTATSTTLPSGAVYVGSALIGAVPYVLAASGAVLTSGGVTTGSFPTYASTLAGSGTLLTALLPASGVGTMTTAGVTGLITFPAGLTTPSCLTMPSGSLAIAGWQTAPALAAANAAALSPIDATSMVAVGSSTAVLWRASGGLIDAWTQSQSLGSLANATALAWSPDGFHIMSASPTSGVIQAIAYATGALSLTQTLAVSGACGVAFGADSIHALIAQSGQSQLAALSFTSVWAAGTPVTGVAGVTTVTAYSTGAVAACTAGLAWLGFASGAWTLNGFTSVGFAPTLLAVDPFLNVYAAGSGLLAVVGSGGTLTGSGSFSGLPTGLAVQQGRVVLSIPAANALLLYGQAAPGVWTQQASITLSLGARIGLGLSETTLFAMGSGSTVTYGFSGTPFVLTSVVSGVVAQRNAGAWVVTSLGGNATPSAIGYDASGNLRVATTQNNQWTISSGGTVLSSGIIAQIPSQAQSVPMGISAIMVSPSGVYCATSVQGTLIEIA